MLPTPLPSRRSFARASALALGVAAALLPVTSASAGGGKVFLDSAISVDRQAGTVTLPLHRGTHAGATVYYVVTESSDKDDAERRGVNYAPKLSNALGTRAVQRARMDAGVVDFPGTVDFAPTRVVVPGPTGFPPKRFAPGAVGDSRYSPLVTTDGRTVINATQVANASGRHDGITAIDIRHARVTLDTFNGRYDGKGVQYLHQEASVALIAAIEGSTYAPNLDAAPGLADNADKQSARAAILPIVNGPLGVNNPQRQGLQSALLGQGDPLNVTTVIPGDSDYSPAWDIHPSVWTPAAIAAGDRVRLNSDSEVVNAVEHGLLVSAGAGPRNEKLKGLRALPGVSNCPVVLEIG